MWRPRPVSRCWDSSQDGGLVGLHILAPTPIQPLKRMYRATLHCMDALVGTQVLLCRAPRVDGILVTRHTTPFWTSTTACRGAGPPRVPGKLPWYAVKCVGNGVHHMNQDPDWPTPPSNGCPRSLSWSLSWIPCHRVEYFNLTLPVVPMTTAVPSG
jgi:hypothetical protein